MSIIVLDLLFDIVIKDPLLYYCRLERYKLRQQGVTLCSTLLYQMEWDNRAF